MMRPIYQPERWDSSEWWVGSSRKWRRGGNNGFYRKLEMACNLLVKMEECSCWWTMQNLLYSHSLTHWWNRRWAQGNEWWFCGNGCGTLRVELMVWGFCEFSWITLGGSMSNGVADRMTECMKWNSKVWKELNARLSKRWWSAFCWCVHLEWIWWRDVCERDLGIVWWAWVHVNGEEEMSASVQKPIAGMVWRCEMHPWRWGLRSSEYCV